MIFILSLAIVLICAVSGRLLSKNIKQPMILGELILGMILGNIGIVRITEQISSLADIGIMLLLFSAGLGTNFGEFKKLETASTTVAFSGVVFPFIFGFLATYFFGFSIIVSLFVGTSLVATSIGVSASMLTEMKVLGTKIGTLIMGAAVIDDIIGVVVISIVISIATRGTVLLVEVAFLIVITLLFLMISLTVGIRFFKKVSEKVYIEKENLLLLGLIVALLFGVITEKIGLAAMIGAFIAGLILGQTDFAKRLQGHVSLIGGGFFIPVFFVTIGMYFDAHAFFSLGMFAVVLVIVAIIGKVLGCGLGAKISNFSWKESLVVGVAMIPRAGVELILIKLGLEYNIIDHNMASAILVMVIITTLITPSLFLKALKTTKTEENI